MRVIKITPRGYCHGVVNALNVVKRAVLDESIPRPIYILGMIVHNKKISKAMDNLGVITLDSTIQTRLELLDQVTEGTVIFTAHGVSDLVIERAKEKGLNAIDASCSDVIKVHDIVKEKLNEGYHVIYIGKDHHPESEGVLGIDSRIEFVTKPQDVKKTGEYERVFVTNQTTLSKYDIEAILVELKKAYPHLVYDNEICNATSTRQEAAINQEMVDLCYVVGDYRSSNSKKLAYVSSEIRGIKTIQIEGLEDIDIQDLLSISSVSVTSGASTPTRVTAEVIRFLEQFNPNDLTTWNTKSQLSDIDYL